VVAGRAAMTVGLALLVLGQIGVVLLVAAGLVGLRPGAGIYPGAGGRSAFAGLSRLSAYCLVVRRLSQMVPSMQSAGPWELLSATTSQRVV
jgi:hypothetical protein